MLNIVLKVEPCVSYLLELDLPVVLLVAEKELHSQYKWKQNILPCKFFVILITHQAAQSIFIGVEIKKGTNNSTFSAVYLKANLELPQMRPS